MNYRDLPFSSTTWMKCYDGHDRNKPGSWEQIIRNGSTAGILLISLTEQERK